MRKLDDNITARLEALTETVAAFEQPTFRCWRCQDRGYVEAERFRVRRVEYTAAKRCCECDTGMAIGEPDGPACGRERLRLAASKAGRLVTVDVERQIDSDDDVPF